MGAAKLYRIGGQRMRLSEIARRTGIELDVLRNRVKDGWPIARAMDTSGIRSIQPKDEQLAHELAELSRRDGDPPGERITYAEALVFVLARRGWCEERIKRALLDAAAHERDLQSVRDEAATLEDTGAEFGLCREGARKIEVIALRKLRSSKQLRDTWKDSQ